MDYVHKVTIYSALTRCAFLNLPLPLHLSISLSLVLLLAACHAPVGRINFIYIVKWFNCLTVDLVLEFQTAKLIV